MRKRYRFIAASLFGASLSLGAIGIGVTGAGASSTTTTTTPSTASTSTALSGLSSVLSGVVPSSIPALPTLPVLPPVCTELAGTPLCGTASALAVMQQLSSIENWMQEFTTLVAQKVPTNL
ncbi:MAG TPA: hypothetical protein VIJ40_01740 [Acidimicrobiales bacterium]